MPAGFGPQINRALTVAGTTEQWAGRRAGQYLTLPSLVKPQVYSQNHDPKSKGPHSRCHLAHQLHSINRPPFSVPVTDLLHTTSSTQQRSPSLRSSVLTSTDLNSLFSPFSTYHLTPSLPQFPAHRPENVDLLLGRARPTGRPSSPATTGNRCLSICQPYVPSFLIPCQTTRPY